MNNNQLCIIHINMSIQTWTWNKQQMEQQMEINLHIYSIVTRIQINPHSATTNRQILTIELIAFTPNVNYKQGFRVNRLFRTPTTAAAAGAALCINLICTFMSF